MTISPPAISHDTELMTAIDNKLKSLLTTEDSSLMSLYEAARYAVFGGGKRLRPLLCILTSEMYGVVLEDILPIACAFELIHNYSLIHDDLPSMDDDDFRRGRPSLHKVYSEGHAILTGDYLLTYAFEVISSVATIDATVRIALIQLLAKSAGTYGMIGGQVLDIAALGKKVSLTELETIHRRKTAALIQAAMVAGALVGKAPHAELELLTNVGQELGLGFQIIDDVIDSVGHEDYQTTSSDLRDDKTTYATLLGASEARASTLMTLKTLQQQLESLGRPHRRLLTLATKMICRDT